MLRSHRVLLTVKETAQILGLPISRVYDLCRQQILPTVRLGRQVRIDPERLEEFIANGGKALPGGWRNEPQ